jgi:hypothetical protein
MTGKGWRRCTIPALPLLSSKVNNKESEHIMDSVEDNVFFNRLGLPDANTANWRLRAVELIGDEEVEFKGFRVQEGKFPIVTLTSADEKAIERVFDAAIAYSDANG